jgi:ornithine decarboxylase
VPGERLTARAQPMLDYLKMFESCFERFPGFDVEIQGVYKEVDASGRTRLYTYVVQE